MPTSKRQTLMCATCSRWTCSRRTVLKCGTGDIAQGYSNMSEASARHRLDSAAYGVVSCVLNEKIFRKKGHKTSRRDSDALEGGEGVLEVGDVLDELDGAAAHEQVVVHHAADGNHGEAAVLELHQLAARKGVGVLAAAQGVKAEVAGHALLAGQEAGATWC